MLTIQIKTLSLLYHAKEDRMMLLINKDSKTDTISYWITRRFYFTMLFEFDTYLDRLGIDSKVSQSNKKAVTKGKIPLNEVNSQGKDDIKKTDVKTQEQLNNFNEPYILLENVNLSFSKDKKSLKLLFSTKETKSESIMSQGDFLNFYYLMKNSFPKGEWGII